MKYKIIKKHSKTLKVTHSGVFPDSEKYMPEKTSIERSEWYEVKRKGMNVVMKEKESNIQLIL